MSEIEIKQMQEKINAGILLARKRLIEKVKKEDGELVLSGMEKSFASKPRTSNNTAYTKAAIISSAIRSRIFYMYPECERASATEKPRISRLFCFLYIQPQLFDGLIFIIDFPPTGHTAPLLTIKAASSSSLNT